MNNNLESETYLLYLLSSNDLAKLKIKTFDFKTLEIFNHIYSNIQPEKKNEIVSLLYEIFFNTKFNTSTTKKTIYTYFENSLRKIDNISQNQDNSYFIELNFEGKNIIINNDSLLILNKEIKEIIYYKIINEYKKFFPKLKTKLFKIDYPYLNEAINIFDRKMQYNLTLIDNRKNSKEEIYIYDKVQEKKKIKEQHYKYHTNYEVSNIPNNLHKCLYSTPLSIANQKYKVSFKDERGNEVQILIDGKYTDIDNKLKKILSPSQSQLFIYILGLIDFNKSRYNDSQTYYEVNIDIKDYCKRRGIEFRKDTAINIYNNIRSFEKISVSLVYTDENKNRIRTKQSFILKILDIDTEYENNRGIDNTIYNKVVTVILGSWASTLKDNHFQYIHNNYFKLDVRNNSNVAILAEYLSNLKKINYREEEFSVTVKVLLQRIPPKSETQIKKKGYKIVLKDPLEKTLDVIKEKIGFHWHYKNGKHISRRAFEEDKIIFRNDDLHAIYTE